MCVRGGKAVELRSHVSLAVKHERYIKIDLESVRKKNLKSFVFLQNTHSISINTTKTEAPFLRNTEK